MARSLIVFQVLLITCLTSCGSSANDIVHKRFVDSIVRSDSIVRVRVEQNKIFSTETIKSLIVGKWVLDSSTSTSIIPEQKDPMYLVSVHTVPHFVDNCQIFDAQRDLSQQKAIIPGFQPSTLLITDPTRLIYAGF